MTTSSDTTFDLNRDDIISDALVNVGAIGPGDAAAGQMRDHAARLLNRVVKALDADGGVLWRRVRRTQALTAGTASYTLGADVFEVEEPINFYRSGQTSRSPVRQMSQDDYAVIADRTVRGQPSHFVIETALPTTMTMILYPTPDATGDTIEYRARVRALDYDTGAQTGDFPSRWLSALVYGLSMELAPGYGQLAQVNAWRALFNDEKQRQLNAGGERGPTILCPWGAW